MRLLAFLLVFSCKGHASNWQELAEQALVRDQGPFHSGAQMAKWSRELLEHGQLLVVSDEEAQKPIASPWPTLFYYSHVSAPVEVILAAFTDVDHHVGTCINHLDEAQVLAHVDPFTYLVREKFSFGFVKQVMVLKSQFRMTGDREEKNLELRSQRDTSVPVPSNEDKVRDTRFKLLAFAADDSSSFVSVQVANDPQPGGWLGSLTVLFGNGEYQKQFRGQVQCLFSIAEGAAQIALSPLVQRGNELSQLVTPNPFAWHVEFKPESL
jgi:hypothetical protein